MRQGQLHTRKSWLVLTDAQGQRQREVQARPKETVAQCLFRAGYFVGRPLCAGLGRCAKCRVRYLDQPPSPTRQEQEVFSDEELGLGWRLSCRHFVGSGCKLIEPKSSDPDWPAFGYCPPPAFLGLDLGTTRIKWRALSQDSRQDAEAMNPQMGAGAEVLSRLRWAAENESGQGLLAKLILDRLGEAIRSQGGAWQGVCLVGNPVMTGIVAGWDLSPLLRPPYTLETQPVRADLGPELPEVYIPPGLGSFVGPDVSAGLTALSFENSPQYPFLYADLGTNAELVLARDEGAWFATSLPLGPALEGVGLSCGAVFSRQAWTRFEICPQGIEGLPAQDDPQGLTGSGVLSLLANLKRADLMGRQGQFRRGQTAWQRRLSQRLLSKADNRLWLNSSLFVSAQDVEEVLKVKAIFHLGVIGLLEAAGVTVNACRQVHLAGSLSQHIDSKDLLELGFLPHPWQGRITCHGNLALSGALDLAKNQAARDWIEDLAGRVQPLDLVAKASQDNGFVRRMHFDFCL